MAKCVYCHKEITIPLPVVAGKDKEVLTCCCDTCKDKTLAFYSFLERFKNIFIVLICLMFGLIFCGAFMNIFTKSLLLLAVFMSSGFVVMGLTCILFPFATPETFSLLGIKKTVFVVRIMGLVIIAISPLLAFFIMSP